MNAETYVVQQVEEQAERYALCLLSYTTLREISYTYDDAGNLKSERRTGVDFDLRNETVDYTYDKASRLTKSVTMSEKGVTTVQYAYDKAGNLLNDGEYTYAYDLQNRLTARREQTAQPPMNLLILMLQNTTKTV